MEAQEGINVAVSDLASSLFSVDWSKDNLISLITERVVHIFELQPNPLCPTPTTKFKRSILYATDHIPVEVFTPIIDTLLLHYEKEDLYSFIFEEALTPKLCGKTDIVPRITQLSWSLCGLVDNHRCLIATVTSAGALDVALKVDRNWYSICNLSSAWWNIIKPEIEVNVTTDQPSSISADTFRTNARRLLCIAVTWSHIFHDENQQKFSYLISAYRSSELAIWKIPQLPKLSYKLTPELVYRKQFQDLGKITKLLFVELKPNEYLILLGLFDGRVLGIHLTEINGEFQGNFFREYEENQDQMPITFLGAKSTENGDQMIVFTKNFVFGTIFVNDRGEIVDRIYIKLPALPISGVTILKDNETLITTQDNKIFHINLKSQGKKFSLIPQEMKTARTHALGLARAPSGVTFVSVTSPNSVYDHLINREPSNIQLFTLKSPEYDPWVKLETIPGNLMNYWDCFEIMRVTAARAVEPGSTLPKLPRELDYATSVHRLRVIMWLTLITEVVKKKIVRKIDNIVGEISEAQPLIFVHTASAHMIRLSQKEKLNDDHRLSIHFLRLYLEVFLAGEEDDHDSRNPVIQHAREAMSATSAIDIIQAEPCNLCGEIVTELPWNTSSCPKGHQLPRCALTLLQITSLKYRSCPVCARIFHNSLDEEYGELRCLYCDVITVYDTRLRGVYDGIDQDCKNLSLRPAWDFPMFRTQEADEDVKDGKSKRRRVTKSGPVASTSTVVAQS